MIQLEPSLPGLQDQLQENGLKQANDQVNRTKLLGVHLSRLFSLLSQRQKSHTHLSSTQRSARESSHLLNLGA